jgi:hypothetical protein
MSMSCLAFRRLLLASPRERTPAQQTHLEGCEDCAQLATDLSALDRKIGRAMRLPVPDGLADRILLPRLRMQRWHYGAAAAALAAAIALGLTAHGLIDPDETALAADAVGSAHPAVAAISMVVEREPALLKEGRTGDPLVMEQRLKYLGLELKKSDVSVRYIGQCEIGGAACDHLVLVTPEGHVSVILMAGGNPSTRALVADRRMTALLSPAPTAGSYIVVAESPKAVKRARRLFVHG